MQEGGKGICHTKGIASVQYKSHMLCNVVGDPGDVSGMTSSLSTESKRTTEGG